MNKFKRFDEILVTVFYLGKIKYAPGTFGTLFALLILFSDEINMWIYAIISIFMLIFVSIKPISRYETKNGNDHSSIVIDEVIGMLVVFSNPYLIFDTFWVIVSFILFRIFDILKPFPINKVNQRNGAWFVIADDLVAGLFSMIILQVLQVGSRILPFFVDIL